jgi:replicative DNA helicase
MKKQIEAELIQRLSVYPQKSLPVAQILTVADFDYYGKAFEIILNCHIDGTEHFNALRKAGFKFTDFDMVFDGASSYRNPEEIAQEVKNLANARNVKNILSDFSKKIPEKEIDKFIAELQVKLINNVDTTEKEKSHIKDIAQEFLLEREEYLKKPKGSLIGISTGYIRLDEAIDGLRPEHLWVLGGYTNTGKTFASLNIIANLVRQGRRVVIYSLEMSKNDVIARLLGIMTKQNGLAIMKGTSHKPIQAELEKIIESNLSIITTKSELSEITFSMYEENMKSPVDLFVVDFIQLITVKDAKSEYEATTDSALSLQQTAKKLKKPMIVVSQISNDGARTGANNPVMSFKGSGAIAAAADLAIEIMQGEEDNMTYQTKRDAGEIVSMKWVVKKNRHGRIGSVKLNFDGLTGRFIQNEEILNENF